MRLELDDRHSDDRSREGLLGLSMCVLHHACASHRLHAHDSSPAACHGSHELGESAPLENAACLGLGLDDEGYNSIHAGDVSAPLTTVQRASSVGLESLHHIRQLGSLLTVPLQPHADQCTANIGLELWYVSFCHLDTGVLGGQSFPD